MSKGLMSYPEGDRARIAARRLTNRDRGNAFWGAKEYFEKTGQQMPSHVSFDTKPATPALDTIVDKAIGNIKLQARDSGPFVPKRPYKKPVHPNKPRSSGGKYENNRHY